MVKTKLQDLRTTRGLSQEEIADLLGMTQSNYSRKEKGITRISPQEWEHMAKKLEVELDEIYQPDESNIIYKNNRGNSFSNFNSGTININIPEFVLEYIEVLKEKNECLNEELRVLKSQLNKEQH